MSTNFPTSLDDNTVLGADVANATPVTDPLHNIDAAFKNNSRDALKAVEAKVGADSSAVTASHDYKIAQLELGPPNPLILATGDAAVTAPTGQAAGAIGHGDGSGGAADVKVASFGSGFAVGRVDVAVGARGQVEVDSLAGFAMGYVFTNDTTAFHDTYIKAGGNGSFAGGYAYGSYFDPSGVVAYGDGSHAFGWVNDGHIGATGTGGAAFGLAKWQGTIRANDDGCLAFGNAYSYGYINAQSHGAFAGGSAGYEAVIEATGHGAFAFGYALSATSGIYAPYKGAFSSGYAQSGGTVTAFNKGARAHGSAKAGGDVWAAGIGSVAMGYANDGQVRVTSLSHGAFASGYAEADAVIYATAKGAFARGYASGVGSAVTASGIGAFASGYAKGGFDVVASGVGSGAFGAAIAANAEANAPNAFQFGEGVNALADSLQVGSAGVRFKGTVGAPAAPQNGDLWVDAGGNVVIRSGGVSVTIA